MTEDMRALPMREYSGGFREGQRVQWGTEGEGIRSGTVTNDGPGFDGWVPVQVEDGGWMVWLQPSALWLRPCVDICDRDDGPGHAGRCSTAISSLDAANIRAWEGDRSV